MEGKGEALVPNMWLSRDAHEVERWSPRALADFHNFRLQASFLPVLVVEGHHPSKRTISQSLTGSSYHGQDSRSASRSAAAVAPSHAACAMIVEPPGWPGCMRPSFLFLLRTPRLTCGWVPSQEVTGWMSGLILSRSRDSGTCLYCTVLVTGRVGGGGGPEGQRGRIRRTLHPSDTGLRGVVLWASKSLHAL